MQGSKSGMKPKIRALAPRDMDSFVELCAHRPGLSRRDAERRGEVVAWIAFHNPDADGDPGYFVVADGDRILGHLGRMPTRFYVEGRPHLASYVHDLFVHPELQRGGRGLFLAMQLYRAAEQASKSFCVLVWTNEINIRIQQARKYEQLWTRRYAKLLRADGLIGKAADRAAARVAAQVAHPAAGQVGHRAAGAVTAIARPLAAGALRVSDRLLSVGARAQGRIERIARFDDRFDRAAARLGPRLGIAPIKTQDYLRWKYAARPALDTATYGVLNRSGELDGYAVVCVPSGQYHDSYLLELVADPDDERTIAALCYRAIVHCRDEGAYALSCMATDPRFARVLRHFLFLPREPRYPLFRANADRYPNPAALARADAWHLSYGDSEGPV